MPPAGRKKTEEKLPDIECGFGCGKPAQGGISVYWTEWGVVEKPDYHYARSRERMLSVMVPSCWKCARGSVSLKVTLPAKLGNGDD